MTNTQVVDIDLVNPGYQATIFAVVGDIYSRFVEMHLYAAGQPYTPPEGVQCVIGWRRGLYRGSYSQIMAEQDTAPETHQAWQLQDNVLTIVLNWEITSKSGPVAVNVALVGLDGSRLHTWELQCQVQPGAVADAEDPTLPNESASAAADRAEAAAEQAQAAAEEAQKVVSESGAVITVNGQGGNVELDAADVGAVALPANAVQAQPGMILSITGVDPDGNITTEAAPIPLGVGFYEIPQDTILPPYQRQEGALYGKVLADFTQVTQLEWGDGA